MEPDGTSDDNTPEETLVSESSVDSGPVQRLQQATEAARTLDLHFEAFCDPATTPVVKDTYLWEHYKREYYYEPDGSRPRDTNDEIIAFDKTDALGFDPSVLENALAAGAKRAEELDPVIDERTVNVQTDFDEDQFFTDEVGATTIANRYDLEKAVPMEKKRHYVEVERYWVKKPYSFVVIFHSEKENEKKYYAIQPYQNEIEAEVAEYITQKLRTAIKYGDHSTAVVDDDRRLEVIHSEAHRLLERYDLYDVPKASVGNRVVETWNDILDAIGPLFERIGKDATAKDRYRLPAAAGTYLKRVLDQLGYEPETTAGPNLPGIAARPEPAVLAEDSDRLTPYQVEKLLYVLKRDFIGYERIDPIKHDINVEDISCDGYNSPVFVYHSEYEQLISNILHGSDELDDFVVKLAQRSGKGISKRRPQVDATLPDGSRAQLTLGREVSDHGTNYTIRQFKEVPFTPVDLINWHTFSLEQMAYLWLCIENNKSLIFAGGTASGKTTSLNAVSLFIPSNSKIVSIEDTREVELPQRNWIASVTRPSFSDDDKGDIDEFDLLESALRQRPDYIVMGEIRGQEGRTLFQVMSTGHTTYTTFHADSVGEVLKRFTTEPINVSKTMFTALDLVSIQTSTRVQGRKVRRNKSLTEINHYDTENDEINVQDVFQWQAETDEFLRLGTSNTLDSIRFDRGWSHEELQTEQLKREAVLAYLVDRDIRTYSEVAATLQAFINDQETILALIANDELEASLADLRQMESVLIDVDPETEALVPRPEPGPIQAETAERVLEQAEEELFDTYRGRAPDSVATALDSISSARDIIVDDGPDRNVIDTGSDTAVSDPDTAGADGFNWQSKESEREDGTAADGSGAFDTYVDSSEPTDGDPNRSEE
ncbi:type II/IV secretion system ATPase subunit [Halalkalirubrum salinum]|uniref:type II/IV secretion system ATPase subunit n=1 Tax=Halalkalirubrum salinum TaxID=2563889 RepID=UPI0010FB976C|nr:type II/IV secretion system ATPase subunit [Halalkalirubrum salinum]